jgi:hypothetical protein
MERQQVAARRFEWFSETMQIGETVPGTKSASWNVAGGSRHGANGRAKPAGVQGAKCYAQGLRPTSCDLLEAAGGSEPAKSPNHLGLNLSHRPPIVIQAGSSHGGRMFMTQTRRRRQRRTGEWRLGVAVHAEPDCDLKAIQGLELVDRERLEVAGHLVRVIRPALENDPRSRVGGNRLSGGLVQLSEVLVG